MIVKHRTLAQKSDFRLEVYTRSDGLWAWHVVGGHGRVVATDGGQGYENEPDAVEMAERVTGLPASVTEPPAPGAHLLSN